MKNTLRGKKPYPWEDNSIKKFIILIMEGYLWLHGYVHDGYYKSSLDPKSFTNETHHYNSHETLWEFPFDRDLDLFAIFQVINNHRLHLGEFISQ